MRKRQKSSGFTLVEALVAVTIIGITGLLLTDLLSRTFKGNSKTELISRIKQNGQSALNIIDQSIRYAASIVCVSPSTDPNPNRILVVKSKGNQYIRFRMVSEITVSGNEANGYLKMDYPQPTDPANPSSLCNSSGLVEATPVELTDTNLINGVSLKPSSRFTLISNPGSKNGVNIIFYLGPGLKAGAGFENQAASLSGIPFETTVFPR